MPPSEQNAAGNVAKAAARGSLYIFIGTASGTAIMALASIIIARFLGPEGYGLYNLSILLPGLLSGFADLGTNAALSKFLPRLRQEGGGISRLIRTGLVFNVAISSALFALLFALSGPLAQALLKRGDIDYLVRMASLAIIFQVIFATANSVFVGMDVTKYNAVVSVAQAAVKFALAILLVSSFGMLGAVAGYALSIIAGGLLALLFCLGLYRGHSGDNAGRGSQEGLRSMLAYGLPIYSSLLLAGVLLRYQQMVLAWYTTNEELGNFYVAMNFNFFMTVVTNPISTMLLPSFSKLEESDELRGFLRYSAKYALFVVAPLSFMVSAVSRDLVRIFYGPEFSLAPSYLAIYILIYSYSVFTLVLGSFFKGTGRVKTFLGIMAVGFTAALPLTLVLVSMWKVVGLAASIFISDAITIALLYREARGRHGISIGIGDTMRIFSASVLSFAVTFLFGMKFQISSTMLSLIVSGAIFVLTYLVASALMGVLRREDLANLRSAFKGTPFTPIIDRLLALYEGITSLLGILR